MLKKLKSYKHRCRREVINFDLSDSQFKWLIMQPCVYCSSKPRWDTPNGIDRLTAGEDYEESNVASCCKTCNFMKSNLPLKVWFDHLNKLGSHNSSATKQRIHQQHQSLRIISDFPTECKERTMALIKINFCTTN